MIPYGLGGFCNAHKTCCWKDGWLQQHRTGEMLVQKEGSSFSSSIESEHLALVGLTSNAIVLDTQDIQYIITLVIICFN